MVVTLIFILALVVFLAFFVGNNISNACTFWFFKTYTDLPVTILVFIAFGAGIVLSLLCVFLARLRKSDEESVRKSAADKVNKAEEKAKKLAEKTARLAEKKEKKLKKSKKGQADSDKTMEMTAADLQNMQN